MHYFISNLFIVLAKQDGMTTVAGAEKMDCHVPQFVDPVKKVNATIKFFPNWTTSNKEIGAFLTVQLHFMPT